MECLEDSALICYHEYSVVSFGSQTLRRMLPISLEVKAICNSIVGPTCAVIYIAIMVYHFISTYKHTQASANVHNVRKLQSYHLSLKYSFVLILIGFWGIISLNIILIDSIATVDFCHAILLTGPPSYIIFKLFMYMILTARANDFYCDSAFGIWFSVTLF